MKGAFVCCLLLLILGFMFSATDASRDSQWMVNEVSLPRKHFQNKIDTKNDKENIGYDESTTRRFDLENMDYGGTGANDHHDPRSPGRA